MMSGKADVWAVITSRSQSNLEEFVTSRRLFSDYSPILLGVLRQMTLVEHHFSIGNRGSTYRHQDDASVRNTLR
jgi:hypothetical protein